MGHKVNPKVFRLNTTTTWNSKWFASKRTFPKNIREDVAIRKFISRQLVDAGIAKIEIERTHQDITITVFSSKPGIVIGRGGSGVEELMKKLKREVLGNPTANLKMNIKEVENPKLSSALVAQGLAADIEKRIPYRRATKRTLDQVVKAGAKGVKMVVSGRLDGAEISRTEKFSVGTVPLHTLRADIDYGRAPAFTTYGVVGVKVWIYKGEVFKEKGKVMKRAVLEGVVEEQSKERKRFTRRK